jgi:hypothetical protein
VRKKKFMGNEIILTEKEWKQIRNRFDSARFKKHIKNFISHVECPICTRYKYENISVNECCDKCPLEISYGNHLDHGCINIINKILGFHSSNEIEFGLTVKLVVVHERYSYEAFCQLEKIVKWLDSFDKIKIARKGASNG